MAGREVSTNMSTDSCQLIANQAAQPARRPHMHIRLDNLSGPEVRELLQEHLSNMAQLSPPESVHALDIEALRKPEITFWAVWSGDELLGCGALKELDPTHGEVKSMRTSSAHRRKGVARAMLSHIIDEARKRSYSRLSLETGSLQAFQPAQKLYASFGFTYCSPFAGYIEDPNSVFMTRAL
jgi:putative acetyltransferase